MCVCVVTNGDELCSLSTRQVGLLDSLNFCQKSACCQVIHCSWGGEDSINTSLRRLDKRTVIIIDLLCFLQQAQDYECLSVALMCWRGSQTLSSCLSAISLTIFFFPYAAARIQALCFANRPVTLLFNLSSRKMITRNHAHLNLRAITQPEDRSPAAFYVSWRHIWDQHMWSFQSCNASFFPYMHYLKCTAALLISRCRWGHLFTRSEYIMMSFSSVTYIALYLTQVSIQSCEFNLCARIEISHKTFANKHHFHLTSQREQNRHILEQALGYISLRKVGEAPVYNNFHMPI